LEGVQAQCGKVHNIFKTTASSRVALDRFLQLQGALVGVVLSEPFKEHSTSAFLRLVAAIIVWPPIPESANAVKQTGLQF
jgi:hypothetical protein